jgi:glutathione synthase
MLKASKIDKDYCKSVSAPISLFPANIPEPFFTYAITIQPLLNTLIEKMARDHQMIHKVLEPFAETDSFPKRLLEVSSKFHAFPYQQKHFLGIIRSDYMLDSLKKKLLMVEYNTIASSFGVLSDRLNGLQQYLFKKYPEIFSKTFSLSKLALSNNFIENSTAAFSKCIELYKESVNSGKERDVYMAVIIQGDERNVYDQKLLEIALFNKHDIKSMRVTFKEVSENGVIDPSTGILSM